MPLDNHVFIENNYPGNVPLGQAPQSFTILSKVQFDEVGTSPLFLPGKGSLDVSAPYTHQPMVVRHYMHCVRSDMPGTARAFVGIGTCYSHVLNGLPQVYTFVSYNDQNTGIGLSQGVEMYRGPFRAPIRDQDFRIKVGSGGQYEVLERGRRVGPRFLSSVWDGQDAPRIQVAYDHARFPGVQLGSIKAKLTRAERDGVKKGWNYKYGTPPPSHWTWGSYIPPDYLNVLMRYANNPSGRICMYGLNTGNAGAGPYAVFAVGRPC